MCVTMHNRYGEVAACPPHAELVNCDECGGSGRHADGKECENYINPASGVVTLGCYGKGFQTDRILQQLQKQLVAWEERRDTQRLALEDAELARSNSRHFEEDSMVDVEEKKVGSYIGYTEKEKDRDRDRECDREIEIEIEIESV